MFVLREAAACVLLLLMLAAPVAALGFLLWGAWFSVRGLLRRFPIRPLSLRRLLGRQSDADPGPSAVLLLPFLLPLLFLPAAMRAQNTPASPPPQSTPDAHYTINVSVREVLLHATVRKGNGTPVSGLDRDDFQVFENGVPQVITHFTHQDIPVTVGIVIDNSGSMRTRRKEVVAAALAFAASSNPQDQMFLVNFNERVSFGLPRGVAFTDQRDRLKTAMGTVIADGKTALYDAVIAALEHLKQSDRDKKVLIVISDGADNASKFTRAQMLDFAARSNVIIFGLGIYDPDDPDNRHPREVLRELSKASGGEAFFPEELRQVTPICERIARDIRDQYSISYVPTNQQTDGGYRAINVRTPKNGWKVITRAGYLAPSQSSAQPASGTKQIPLPGDATNKTETAPAQPPAPASAPKKSEPSKPGPKRSEIKNTESNP